MPQPSHTDLIELSHEAFINALQGEEVKDMHGNKRCFLNDHYKQVNIQKVYLENTGDTVMIKGDLEFTYNITISECDFSKAKIEIYSGRFLGKIKFINSCPCGQVEIYGGEFHERISFGSNFIYGLHIYGGEFKNRLSINLGEVKGYLEIGGGLFHKPVWVRGDFMKGATIKGGKFLNVFAIMGSNFQSEVKIEGGSFQDFNINECNFIKGITFTGGEFNSVSFISKQSYISKISLNTQIRFPITIKEYPINEIFISGLNYENGGIYLENIQPNQLVFKSFKNYGKLSIENLNATENNSSLQIINSDLGNFLAFDVNFNSFHNIVFNNSKLSKLNMYGGAIPINAQKIFTNDEQERDHAQLADLYNQLYLAMQSQGYRDYEMKYYAAYLENHRLHLKEKREEFSTRIALCLHKFSTNYSQNWVRGFVLTIIIAWPLYYFYFISLPEFDFAYGPNRWSWGTFNLFMAHYFEFLLPTHRMDFIEDTKASALSYFIDVLSRVIIGFFIYQTIAAFRKFGKK